MYCKHDKPPCKDDNALENLIKYELNIYAFVSVKCKLLIFIWGFTAKVTCAFLVRRNLQKSSQNNDGIFFTVEQIKVVTWTLSSLFGGSFKKTVLLMINNFNFWNEE